MIMVKDAQGNIIPGLFKDKSGALVVSDTAEFAKYKRQQQLAHSSTERIKQLSNEVDSLKEMVAQLMSRLGPTHG